MFSSGQHRWFRGGADESTEAYLCVQVDCGGDALSKPPPSSVGDKLARRWAAPISERLGRPREPTHGYLHARNFLGLG